MSFRAHSLKCSLKSAKLDNDLICELIRSHWHGQGIHQLSPPSPADSLYALCVTLLKQKASKEHFKHVIKCTPEDDFEESELMEILYDWKTKPFIYRYLPELLAAVKELQNEGIDITERYIYFSELFTNQPEILFEYLSLTKKGSKSYLHTLHTLLRARDASEEEFLRALNLIEEITDLEQRKFLESIVAGCYMASKIFAPVSEFCISKIWKIEEYRYLGTKQIDYSFGTLPYFSSLSSKFGEELEVKAVLKIISSGYSLWDSWPALAESLMQLPLSEGSFKKLKGKKRFVKSLCKRGIKLPKTQKEFYRLGDGLTSLACH